MLLFLLGYCNFNITVIDDKTLTRYGGLDMRYVINITILTSQNLNKGKADSLKYFLRLTGRFSICFLETLQ